MFSETLETLDITGFRTKIGLWDDVVDNWWDGWGFNMFGSLTTLRLVNCYVNTQGWLPRSLETFIIIDCLLSDKAHDAIIEHSFWPNIRKIHIENSGIDLSDIEYSLYVLSDDKSAKPLRDFTLISEPFAPASVDQELLEQSAAEISSLTRMYGDFLETLSLTYADSLGNSDLRAIGEHCNQRTAQSEVEPETWGTQHIAPIKRVSIQNKRDKINN